MRKVVKLMTIIALISTFGLQAQNQIGRVKKPKNHQKIIARKMAFMKKNLKLNEQEAKNFETAYKAYMEEKMALNKKFKEEVAKKVKKNNLSKLSESEKKQIIETKFKIDKQQYELDRNFNLKLTKILPSEKVIRYFKLDRQFNKILMKRLKEHALKRKHQAMTRKQHAMDRKHKVMKRKQKVLENR